ncbi:uncharacterized protein LOC121734222 [Aricia agestis]|uniref:uncharacterized protein LOC121734222 n=1 Tax=Aricia agestis TaxID=91739 RepID=UPI001C203AE6|nr:uncharacterized protein LOC121734222 [Aricia agestis]
MVIKWNLRRSVTIVFLIALVKTTTSVGENCKYVHRSKRQLIYPNTTLLQLNIGVGTPSPVKQVNVNWAIQANFQLPWNRTQIPIDILHANTGYDGEAREEGYGETRKKRDIKHREEARKREIEGGDSRKKRQVEGYVNDARLYHFYKYVEDMLNSFGENGTSCVLQTLCRLGAEPLHSYRDDDLLHEIASFVLNPLNDESEDTANESIPYISAYKLGLSGHDCGYQCGHSLIDLFSQIH